MSNLGDTIESLNLDPIGTIRECNPKAKNQNTLHVWQIMDGKYILLRIARNELESLTIQVTREAFEELAKTILEFKE